MRLWLCTNHPDLGTSGYKFEAEKPVCPGCGVDGEAPGMGGVVLPRAVIHFDPPHPVLARRGLNRRACEPGKHVGHGGGLATGQADEVNCPACKATAAYKAAGAAAVPELYRVPDPIAAPAAE